jgi:hypothetical protein
MPPIRFLHAAGLDPDAPLAAPSPALADLFASAQIAAVERLVTQAIERDVDFLLVTPAPPADGLPDGLSLKAEAALRGQFDRLLDHDVAVFLAVGSRTTGWERLAGRDTNVVLLTPGSFTAISDRDGRPAAILRCVDRPTPAERSIAPAPGDSLELAVAPRTAPRDLAGSTLLRCDYLALGAGPRESLALGSTTTHSPGPLAPHGPEDAGPHGATLVTIADDGHVRSEFVPASPVRYEAIAIDAEPHDGPEDLALRMTDRLAGRTPEPGEQAWVVRWAAEVAGPLADSLAADSGRADLLGLLPEEVAGVPVFHELSVSPHKFWPALDDPFAAEFAAALNEQEPALCDPSARSALLALPADAPHRDRLARLLATADAAGVVNEARRLGRLVSAAANEDD